MAGQQVSAFGWQLQQQLADKTAEGNFTGSSVSCINLYIALGLALNGAGDKALVGLGCMSPSRKGEAQMLLKPPRAAIQIVVWQYESKLRCVHMLNVDHAVASGISRGHYWLCQHPLGQLCNLVCASNVYICMENAGVLTGMYMTAWCIPVTCNHLDYSMSSMSPSCNS